jgi:hypothetical protein
MAMLLAPFGVAALLILLWPRTTGLQGPVQITVLGVTNDASGGTWALLCATNGTSRLFVRGRSEIERQAFPSNQTTVVQITSVDYLKPGQAIFFSVKTPVPRQPWRLNFIYIGQLTVLERLKEGLAWFWYRRGFHVSEKRLRLTPVRDVTTGWIND